MPTLNLYVLTRNYVLVTTSGRAIEFKKGVSTHVPRECIREAVAIGATPADGSDVSTAFEESALPKAPTNPEERLESVLGVVRDLVQRNDRDDFTAAGIPSPKVISKILGWKVDLKEANIAYRMYTDEVNALNEQAKLDARGA